MATNPIPEPVDPIDEDAERVFAHPEIRAAIERHEAWKAAGRPGALTTEEIAAKHGLQVPDLD